MVINRKSYTSFLVAEVARARDIARRTLKAEGGEAKYVLRTFYLGPRRGYRGRQRTTNKADAYAAKIAVYRLEPSRWSGEAWPVLVGYI